MWRPKSRVSMNEISLSNNEIMSMLSDVPFNRAVDSQAVASTTTCRDRLVGLTVKDVARELCRLLIVL